MKKIGLLLLMLAAAPCFAQTTFTPGAAKPKVLIVYSKHAVAGNLAEYMDTADIRVVTKQTGKTLCKEILQKRTLPACYTSLLNNQLSKLIIYQVAEYTTMQPDELGLDMEEMTYAILQVPYDENKNAAGSCNFDKTFFIRIPADDIRMAR